MRGMLNPALLAGMSVLLMPFGTITTPFVPHTTVAVRVYDSFGLPRDELAAARRVVDDIFRHAQVHVEWRECRTAAGPPADAADACADTLRQREVIARIATAQPTASGSPAVFGYSLVDVATRVGTLATVYADRISARAAAVGVNRATLLGRALAHEIGHLLLGTNRHASRGLMRASWPDQALRDGAERDWQFSAGEVRQVNRSLLARARVNPELRAATGGVVKGEW